MLFNLFVQNMFWDKYISQGRPFMIPRADANEVGESAEGRHAFQSGKFGNER